MKQETTCSLFRSLTTAQPPEPVTLAEVHRLITTDVILKENTEKFRYFRSKGFEADADKVKRSRCPVFTPAAVFDGKRHGKNLMSYTQYSLVDIDGLAPNEAKRMVQQLKNDPYWLLVYITLSGRGIRIIYQVEGVTDKKTYLKAFYQGNAHYCRLLGVAGFDDKVKDVPRGSVLSHDPGAFYRAGAQAFPVNVDKVTVHEV